MIYIYILYDIYNIYMGNSWLCQDMIYKWWIRNSPGHCSDALVDRKESHRTLGVDLLRSVSLSGDLAFPRSFLEVSSAR